MLEIEEFMFWNFGSSDMKYTHFVRHKEKESDGDNELEKIKTAVQR